MSALLLDTQAVVWMLFSPDKLSETARQAIDAANQNGDTLYVYALSLVELTFLVEKGRLPQIVLDTLTEELANSQGDLVAAPVDVVVAQKVKLIPRSQIPELPDRVIAAMALSLGLPLVTSDLKIRASGVSTIW
ncbi:MAG: PIN domain-containing protein [Caldilinea sp. CFX5]|nr:PIN domain-containing protein [Caldilinea sp. CFX5]